MHPVIYQAFEEMGSRENIRGAVLEVGAVPGSDSLLRLPSLQFAAERVGVNLSGSGDYGAYKILQANANDLHMFADGYFSAVLSNATLEHDPFFWKSLGEMKRVLAPSGLMVIGVPGYSGMGLGKVFGRPGFLTGFLNRFSPRESREWIRASTLTLGVHQYPGDFYRFSEQAVREVFMEGLNQVSVQSLLIPPRFVASGRKPA